MIIKPNICGITCTTAHPIGCEENVNQQIAYVKSKGKIVNGPKKVLVIGASTGYGLASRITAAFGSDAATIGVFLEKPGSENKTGTAGWYNSAAFDKAAKSAGLYAKSINGDAFSDECRQVTIDLIKKDLSKIDLVIYSLASPVRKIPDTGEVVRLALKPIGQPYQSIALDTNKDVLIETVIEPANRQEIANTVKVLGGQDWELWMDALTSADVLADNVQTVSYSYIGSELTWPIYRNGTLGKAKEDLERAADSIDKKLSEKNGHAYVAVLKSVVTQSSSAIPVIPLYIAISFKVMKEQEIHEDCIEQIQRMFASKLYVNGQSVTDDKHRLRLDDWELRPEIQNACQEIQAQVTNDTIYQLTDYQSYKEEFLRLFGFGLTDVDYNVDVNVDVQFDIISLV